MLILLQVRSSSKSPVSLDLTLKVPRDGIIVPGLQNQSVAMTQKSQVGPYNLYQASYSLDSSQTQNTKFDVSTGGVADSFKSTGDLSSACKSLGSSS